MLHECLPSKELGRGPSAVRTTTLLLSPPAAELLWGKREEGRGGGGSRRIRGNGGRRSERGREEGECNKRIQTETELASWEGKGESGASYQLRQIADGS